MNTKKNVVYTVLGLLAFALILTALTMPVWAQTNTTTSGNPEAKYGVYDITQSAEFGGKIVSTDGNKGMWSTLVNQTSGGRLMSESFDMHAAKHNGFLFDDLSLNTFGYGDPNNVGTVKILKGKYYSFVGNFRRDKTFFDYNLLANTMNPPSTSPNVGYTISPHQMAQTRKLQDYKLELFPVSRFKVRLGYGYENTEGRQFWSSHFGTEPVYTRNLRTTNNTYNAGFTFKVVQGTSITFDHKLSHFKNDTLAYDQNQLFTLNGRPVDMGLPWAGAPYNAPCATPIVAGAVNPVCNGYYAYTQFLPTRTNLPTDTIGFTSTYKKFNQTGRVFYSGGESITPNYNELLDGLTTRTNTRITNTTGNMYSTRVGAGAEYAATFTINNHFRLVESFRWDAARIPSTYYLNQSLLTGTSLTATPNVFNPATCPSPYTAATCPQHTTSTGADLTTQYYHRFEGEDLKTNLVSLEFDANRHFGGHVGFRYDTKSIRLNGHDMETLTYYPGAATTSAARTSARQALCVGSVVDVNGVCKITTEHFDGEEKFEPSTKAFVGGFWMRPVSEFRMSFDAEYASTDKPWLVIAPKTFLLYRMKSSYKPNEKFAFLFSSNLLQRSNDEAVKAKAHSSSLSFDTMYNPTDKFGVDLGYQYTGVSSDSFICYWANPNILGSAACATNPVATYYQTTSFYRNNSHFGSVNFTFRPTARFRGSLGYAATRTGGNTLLTGQYQSLGPLDSIYHMPQAAFEFDLNKTWTWKTAWNYYGYDEGSYQMPGVTLPRDIRGNVVSLSLKYNFGQAR